MSRSIRTFAGELMFSTTDYLVSLAGGLMFVLIGGFVAGRMARGRFAMHGLCVGIVVLVLSIVIEMMSPDSQAPAWFNVASFVGRDVRLILHAIGNTSPLHCSHRR